MPRLPLLVVALLTLAGPAAADDVAWRHDYAAARKEAADTGRPLLLDFGTEACGFCKKLDATTFRDPAVVKALNAGFIPVKIDAHAERRIAEALHVEAYPTLVVAAADGKVVERHAGYVDGPQLLAMLTKAPAPAKAKPAEKPAEQPRRPDVDAAALDALYPKIAAALAR